MPDRKNGPRYHNSFKAYKEVQKQVQTSVNDAKRKFERKLAKAKKKNSKSLFSYVKKKTKNKESVGPLL